jgi:hypothetical protein
LFQFLQKKTYSYIICWFYRYKNYLVNKTAGTYGGWRAVPESYKAAEKTELVDPYFSNSLSKKQWFKNWSSFNDLLQDLISQKEVGNYIVTSDIANFYDTIDTNKLCNNLSYDVEGDGEVVSLLKAFLSFWDRRIRSYEPSTKGIPQETISDASRLLANYYLKFFDEKFLEYCDENGLTYLRWADDIIVIGKSKQKLELCIHKASRILLSLGLNLSAAKTNIYSKSDFRMYRGLGVLSAVRDKDLKKFDNELRRFDKFRAAHPARVDTVYRAAINFCAANPRARNPYALNFIT